MVTDADTCERVSGVWSNLLSAMLLLLIVRLCASVLMLLARRQCNSQWRGRRPSQPCSGRWLTAGADAAAARVMRCDAGCRGSCWCVGGKGTPDNRATNGGDRPTGEINNGVGEAADSCVAS